MKTPSFNPNRLSMPLPGLVVLAGVVLLTGCDSAPEQGAPQSQQGGSAVTELYEPCSDIPDSANLLLNAELAINPGTGFPEHWNAAQHAGDRVYTLSSAPGEITIDKDGEQHWYTLTQRIDASAIQGRQLRFDAEIKLDMHADGWQQALTPGGGLHLFIMGEDSKTNRRNVLLYESILEHEPKLGQHDWFCASINLQIPDGARWITAGVLHQAYGSVAFRKPALLVID